ncbi:hypothetical protein GCM10010324_30340 [Streptomyces hiroshimensis]|uniref:Uncharacterized protein n=1 Tax=Streptomyces hiroshimensis TaxID=66424 RepID=A0ABQ2YFV0_9ACTN|nr:hypothetical protein GCM10010324_30340 [Streptomyces hiroshimensis]
MQIQPMTGTPAKSHPPRFPEEPSSRRVAGNLEGLRDASGSLLPLGGAHYPGATPEEAVTAEANGAHNEEGPALANPVLSQRFLGEINRALRA